MQIGLKQTKTSPELPKNRPYLKINFTESLIWLNAPAKVPGLFFCVESSAVKFFVINTGSDIIK
jgi:hypothetical protein